MRPLPGSMRRIGGRVVFDPISVNLGKLVPNLATLVCSWAPISFTHFRDPPGHQLDPPPILTRANRAPWRERRRSGALPLLYTHPTTYSAVMCFVLSPEPAEEPPGGRRQAVQRRHGGRAAAPRSAPTSPQKPPPARTAPAAQRRRRAASPAARAVLMGRASGPQPWLPAAAACSAPTASRVRHLRCVRRPRRVGGTEGLAGVGSGRAHRTELGRSRPDRPQREQSLACHAAHAFKNAAASGRQAWAAPTPPVDGWRRRAPTCSTAALRGAEWLAAMLRSHR